MSAGPVDHDLDVDADGGQAQSSPETPAAAAEDRDRLVAPGDRRPDTRELLREPLSQRPGVRAGIYAWSLIGLTIVAIAFMWVLFQVSTVVIPLILALFPAAVLQPATDRLKARGVPDALAALVVLLLTLGSIGGLVGLLAPTVADQLESLGQSITEGYSQLENFLADGPFGLDPIRIDDLLDQFTAQMDAGFGGFAGNALGLARAVFEGATAALLMLIVLFFYLKDGRAISRWVVSVFPERLHEDARIIGEMLWRTIGGYIQGQLLVALIDAIGIGLGLWLLGVPLALPLAVIVFFGGLFPVIGAFISGSLAALVALATRGPGTALAVIAVTLAVQQLEGNLLQPVILGRSVSLHPLAIILSLTIGGFIFGVLGAFLAVPVAAGGARAVGYLRQRIPG